ncbi:dna primase : DNA primase OS=Planctomyces limnophilus (strain ATCC 43296 / DSM 3776 / IFAM 1008 / 290) GN=Plim_0213 PE=3 SV=1: zf-CHC2: Toprim_N: Toprim_4 [Gemmata massiliana]|uniref:DNA primase n=1 Tax=Gemmata massiliana TaxID=1210884 RepID=A0A6P2DA76_9BACT|nr:DNA primase [Gemmata massiliana]VTR98079.1 dna primase : DNA primase OS=Planctomyces limnophilus (strain ATCC 43296 / DSM 3776 / IFAM 1008 / 290) GN=Plim_0213 PE=3 SV=1: zf-CHC2: Toprim_N: Toprim_4 [Gemmata massiliana]
MPSDQVELTKQVKAASDIVAVVGSYINIIPAGKIFKAVCPFHTDTRPSLDIDPQRQRYKCWACEAHGDVFSFTMFQEKVGFKEARAILAAKAGIKLDEQQSPQDYHRTKLLEVMRWAQAKYAYHYLEADEGADARKYMGERKLAGKTVRDFGIGFAPIIGDWLVKLAQAERVPVDVLVETGLLATREGNRGYYDRFRDRVMFPIKDVRGQVVGFGGRIMPNNPLAARGPKYYNSAETPLFHKSELLYGLDLARHANAGYIAVVEGYTDVMMAHQCGVPQVVATMGTALNPKHVAQLRRYVPKVVLLYDADAGGYTGVDRALAMFVSQDVELAVATLPEGLDPCDLLVRPNGIDTFKEVLTSAVDALDFKLNKLLERDSSPSIETKRRITDDILGIMASAPPIPGAAAQVKRELIITRLSQRLGSKQETLWARFGELRKEYEQKERETEQKEREQRGRDGRPTTTVRPDAVLPTNERPRGGAKAGPAVAAERQLVELLLSDPTLVAVAAPNVTPEEITHSGLRRILTELLTAQSAGMVPDLEALRERLNDRPDLFEAAQTLQFVGQQMQDREQWLSRLLKRFSEMKAEAEAKKAKELLTGASDAETIELLRRIQQTRQPKRPKTEEAKDDDDPEHMATPAA